MSALSETIAEIDAVDHYRSHTVGSPDGDDWIRYVDLLEDDAVLDRWFTRVLEQPESAGKLDYVGSTCAGALSGILVEPLIDAVVFRSRAWIIDPGTTYVHQHPDGWCDGVVMAPGRAIVLPDDPKAWSPDVIVVPDLEALHVTVADHLVPLLATLFSRVRSRGRFGYPGMWGGITDLVVGGPIWSAKRRGLDAAASRAAYERGLALLEVLAERAPVPALRPRILDVDWAGGTAPIAMRCTCCLYYRTQPAPDKRGEGYCVNCPLRDQDSVAPMIAAYWEQEAAG